MSKKVEMREMQGLKPETPNLCHLSGEACGGLKPFSVMSLLELFGAVDDAHAQRS